MRPAGLPEFKNPPLAELSIGVQFQPAPNYQQIYAGEVWGLFKIDFPNVTEQPALTPQFETFGTPNPPTIQFGLTNAAAHDRFWFTSANGDELIQFQKDRLHHNWRRLPNKENTYPRFDSLVVRFSDEIRKLEAFLSKHGSTKLICNQVELTYVNHIWDHDVTKWLNVFGSEKAARADDISIAYRRVLKDEAQKPTGRIIVDCGTGIDFQSRKILILNITVRGAPENSSVDGALSYLEAARSTIVTEFNDISTDYAHKQWQRTSP
jgi:uncharacterized protein (TIGR04255 family)